MDDMISRRKAIDAFPEDALAWDISDGYIAPHYVRKILEQLPSAEPEISRIEQELHGKTPEEQYEVLYWLLLKFGLTYTDSRLAVIEWLRGEQNERGHDQQTGGD